MNATADPDPNTRRLAVLAELSELGLSLARELHARVIAVENATEAAELGLAFQRTARAVRQAVALEARLERDARRITEDDRKAAERQATERVEHRKAQVRAAVERAVRPDYSETETEDLLDDLDLRLEEAALLDDAFVDAPLDDLIARLQADLGVGVAEEDGEEASPVRRRPPRANDPPRPLFEAGELEMRIARETYEPYASP